MYAKLALALLAVLIAAPAWGGEMAVQLKSGNRLVIQYSGAIEKVALEGTSDAIVGVSMPTAAPIPPQSVQPAPAPSAPSPVPATASVPPVAPISKKDDSKSQFRWASPKMED